MHHLLVGLLILFLAAPSWGFVEKLAPNVEGGIPCHAIGAALFNFVIPGGPPPNILSSIIQREWVPGGWSAQDIADNTAVVEMLNGLTQIEKYVKVHEMEYACLLWEMGVDEHDSPGEFRSRIGLPAVP